MRTHYKIRKLVPEDQDFLYEMLFQSIFHIPGTKKPERSLLKEPGIRHYVEEWGRPGDSGYLAVDERTGLKLGAVWLRFFTEDDPGYGYLSDNIPEIGIALLPDRRGRGIGTTLLRRLIDDPGAEWEEISLSVDPENPAAELYRRQGLRECGAAGTSLIMKLDRKRLTLREGEGCILREAVPGDAPGMLEFLAGIAAESDNLTFGPGEMKISLEEEETFLSDSLGSDRQLFLVAVREDEILGNLHFAGGTKPRLAHAGEFGISVRKAHWGKGIAGELLSFLLHWAVSRGYTKINLKVRTDNDRAVRLYRRFGFEIEGESRRQFRIEGRYYNTYLMGKIL